MNLTSEGGGDKRFPVVCFNVERHVIPAFEGFFTLAAGKGPLRRVCHHVGLELIARYESFPTGFADVGLFSGVGSPHVDGQMDVLNKGFPTEIANIRLLTCVDSQVPSKV